ncbi:uncharacterized protein [Elaeis guineensis]|uniref:uncharacterized protein n=1 Tax=Elaeis guineensis var. tenera TaxID=51953 RepID=UPI003C6D5DB9
MNFMGITTITETTNDKTPKNAFVFVPFSEITQGMDETYLIDVIGELVGEDNVMEKFVRGRKSKLMKIELEDLDKNKLSCTLWGEFADQICSYLAESNSGPIIVVLLLFKVKSYQEKVGISNAYYGSKLLINPTLKEAADFSNKNGLYFNCLIIHKRISQISGHSSYSISDDWVKHTERKTIDDVLDAAEEEYCAVLATILEIESGWNDWWYQGCTKCSRKVQSAGTKFYCEGCDKLVQSVPRFKVQVKAIDQTGSTSLIFDREATQFLGKTASEIRQQEMKNGVGCGPPAVLNNFVGKKFVFKINIKKLNVKSKWSIYSVMRMSDDADLLEHFNSTLADNKESVSDEVEYTSPTKTPSKRFAEDVSDTIVDDPTAQLSGNKLKKVIKVEKY